MKSILLSMLSLVLLAGSTRFAPDGPRADRGLDLGNPAVGRMLADTGLVLLDHPGYQVIYEHARNQALFTAWHLQADDLGEAARSLAGFAPDTSLPAGWYRVVSRDYAGGGYDRGHLCPSADRTASPLDNRDTFVLSNVVPQAKGLNRHTWEALEAFTRQRVQAGLEAYVFAGGIGERARIGTAHTVPVPAYYWKVILLMPAGVDDAHRLQTDYHLVAVLMPNIDQVAAHPWAHYRVPLERIEQLTGLTFFTHMPAAARASLCQN